MRAFVTVVEEGGPSAAARRLHISQPALSQTMNALERELGVQLLVRSTTGVEATDAGMTLLGEARGVLARHDQALAAMAVHTAPMPRPCGSASPWNCRPTCCPRHWPTLPRPIRPPGSRPGICRPRPSSRS